MTSAKEMAVLSTSGRGTKLVLGFPTSRLPVRDLNGTIESLGSYLRSQFAGGSNREASQYWIVALSLSCAVLVVCRMSEW